MNTVLDFLEMNGLRLGLEHFGAPAQMSCVVVTPRFRASSHVVFLLLTEGRPDPALVAKVTRLPGANASITREAANLRLVQAARAGGFDSIPRVIAFEEHRGHSILVETALVGRPMDRPTVRRDLAGCCTAVTHWLTEVQRLNHHGPGADPGWFERLVEGPLRQFAEVFPLSDEEAQLLKRTEALASPLCEASLPMVVEHGDLCHPNLFLLKESGLGVVDWELAESRGLPTYDLFFFLSYAAFAQRDARTNREYVSAFHAAFFGHSAWARPYVLAYAERLQLAPRVLTPLFVLCWVRYMIGLLTRLGETDRSDRRVSAETAAWLRTNRYYALWRHALAHMDELEW